MRVGRYPKNIKSLWGRTLSGKRVRLKLSYGSLSAQQWKKRERFLQRG